MQESNQPEKKPLKPFLVSYGIVILVLLLLNLVVMPLLLQGQVQEVDYGTFLQMLEDKQLTTVQLEEETIYFVDAESKTYRTNVIPQDYAIVNRLVEAGVTFDRVYDQPSLLEYILRYWVLPFLPLILLATLVSRQFNRHRANNAGGMNAMMFGGKSGAKQYVVDDKTGITFADVAGQDEAKESLQEIVDFLHNPQ